MDNCLRETASCSPGLRGTNELREAADQVQVCWEINGVVDHQNLMSRMLPR